MAKIDNHRAKQSSRYAWHALIKAEKYYFTITVHADNKIDAINKTKKMINLCQIADMRRL